MDINKIKESKTTEELIRFSIINIDKPKGPTSFSVGQFIKKSLGLKKTSHLGTLDPAVTGVLPISLDRACRLNTYLMRKNKTYVGVMRLHEDVSDDKIKEEMEKFVGKIKQLPPVRSSVKRAEREREVFSFDFIEKNGKDVLFSSEVEAGTYIRKLVHDLGVSLGVKAHMLELRRVRAGIFDESKMYNLYDFEKAVSDYKNGDDSSLREMLVPGEIIGNILKSVEIKPNNLRQILTGKPIFNSDVASKVDISEGEYFAVFCNGRLIEIALRVKDGDIFGRPDFVLN